jgi:ferric-dicitrate binding protein FerR (iron transport regulator)
LRPVIESAGLVLVAVAGWYFLQPWTARLWPTHLATNDRSAKVIVGDAVVDLAPRSSLDVRSRDPRAAKVVLERGTATFDIVPRHPAPAPFEVATVDLLVLATDARFSITSGRESSSLAVERGVVQAEANGRAFSVSAGERWPAN